LSRLITSILSNVATGSELSLVAERVIMFTSIFMYALKRTIRNVKLTLDEEILLCCELILIDGEETKIQYQTDEICEPFQRVRRK